VLPPLPVDVFVCTKLILRNSGVPGLYPEYTGGQKENPTYAEVSAGKTGTCRVPSKSTMTQSRFNLEELLDWFWRHIDPTMGADSSRPRGPVRSVIFYHDEEQKSLARRGRKPLGIGKFHKPIATEMSNLPPIFPGRIHQDYHQEESDSVWGIIGFGSGRANSWKRLGESKKISRSSGKRPPSKNQTKLPCERN